MGLLGGMSTVSACQAVLASHNWFYSIVGPIYRKLMQATTLPSSPDFVLRNDSSFNENLVISSVSDIHSENLLSLSYC